MLLHYPYLNNSNSNKNNWKYAWRQLEEFYNQGKIKALGVSNFLITDLEELLIFSNVKPTVVQSYTDPLIQNMHLIDFCSKNNIQYTAYSLLGTQHLMNYQNKNLLNPILNNPIICNIATKLSKSPAQIVLKWAIQNNLVVIPRTSNFEHMQENYNINFSLNNETIKQINLLGF